MIAVRLFRPNDRASRALCDWWAKHQRVIVGIGTSMMLLAAVPRLAFELHRLLFDQSKLGAIDLRIFHEFVQGWFGGRPVYLELTTTNYPPASFVLLWPLAGWLPVTAARWLFAAVVIASLTWLTVLIVRESEVDASIEKALIALFIVSIYPTAVTIGNGQHVIYIVAALLSAVLLLQRYPSSWLRDILAAALVTFSLVKPTVSVPFCWLVLFIPKRARPMLLVVIGYAILTLFAASFQPQGFFTVMREALDHCLDGAAREARLHGYANIHSWLAAAGLQSWNLPASLVLLFGLGYWIYCNRNKELWLLLGVTAIVSRIWTHHPVYEDLLILLPMVTLLRITGRSSRSDGSDVTAGILLAVSWFALLAPATMRLWPAPWNFLFTGGEAAIWLTILVFLLIQAHRQADARDAP